MCRSEDHGPGDVADLALGLEPGSSHSERHWLSWVKIGGVLLADALLISDQEWELRDDRGEDLCEWAVFILDNIEEKGGHDEISDGYFIANQELSKDTLCL